MRSANSGENKELHIDARGTLKGGVGKVKNTGSGTRLAKIYYVYRQQQQQK